MPTRDALPQHVPGCRESPKLLRLFIASLSLGVAATAETLPRHARLFPPNDEYDANLLDPRTLYGSPFGGFSRATSSRLASLPLKLPDDVVPDDDNAKPEHYETADHLGRPYVCRVFDDTELDYGSLRDSRFDPPGFRFRVQVEDSAHRDVGERVARVLGVPTLGGTLDFLEEGATPDGIPVGPPPPPVVPPQRSVSEMVVAEFTELEIDRRMDALQGLCVQRRFHYWTFEWCYGQSIQRFHLSRHEEDANYPKIQITNFFSMGHFKSITITVPWIQSDDDDDDQDNERRIHNFPMGSLKENFADGDRCTPNGDQAKTTVHMRCCSTDTILEHPSSAFIHGVPHDIPMASILSVWQDSESQCRYHMEVCTPVLCESTSVDDLYDRIELLGIEEPTQWPKATQVFHQQRPAQMELRSVSEILDETLGDQCIYSERDGWWTYEYCHNKYVRQFHGTTKKVKKDPTDENQYLLGFYNPKEANSSTEEWRHVINVTDVVEYGAFAKRARGGNGAYYEIEYVDGDMCLLEGDVADDEFAAIERSSSVRLSCDNAFSVTVREDVTCHYVVEVTVPTLCEHVLFKPALTKKRVVKCLPMDDP